MRAPDSLVDVLPHADFLAITLPFTDDARGLVGGLMTPHVSGWTDGTLAARATLIAENIGRVSRPELPRNLVPTR